MSRDSAPRAVMPSVNPGEQPLEALAPRRQEPVGMAGMRHALARRRLVEQIVPLDDGDAGKTLGEHPGGDEPGDAAADHDGMAGRVKAG